MLTAADPDAMAISLPRNTLDVHMASVSSSPMVSTVQYSSRPAEFVSSSLGRVPENALGLRTASPSEMSPSAVDNELVEQQRRAQLRQVLSDHTVSPSTSLSRKPTLAEAGSDRSRPSVSRGMSSTRTPCTQVPDLSLVRPWDMVPLQKLATRRGKKTRDRWSASARVMMGRSPNGDGGTSDTDPLVTRSGTGTENGNRTELGTTSEDGDRRDHAYPSPMSSAGSHEGTPT
ncbi:hypothetical protein NUW54_g11495 [Trametes sanguinea]|uniref:Uncharacterized protein n=1 Tax=Trametes sanguinea TaxID=158606 RepID=A0ACC1NDK0_9APHY|nr:hypothetical protein NUW54_g11495 [Trametes sanguinea]